MDLSKLTDAELEAIASGAGAASDAAPDISKLSDAELAQLAGLPTAPAAETDRVARATGLAGRASMTGLISGWGTPAALVADAVRGVGRDITYAGHLGLSKLGVTDKPNEEKYYGEGPAFPITESWQRASTKPADVIGLPNAETPGERIVMGGIEGAAGATNLIGAGKALAKFGPRVMQRLGGFMSANPVVQTTAGAAGGAAGAGTVEAGFAPAAPYAGVAASLVPLVLSAGRAGAGRVTSTSAPGQTAIAGEILRAQAADPARALRNLETHQPAIRGWQHTGVAAARDPGLAALESKFVDLSKLHDVSGPARMAENNATILSDALDKLGARGGTADQTRRTATALARQAEGDIFNVPRPPIDITPMLRDLEGITLRRGADTATASTAENIRQRLIDASRPHLDARGNVVGWRIDPRNLHRARADIGNPPAAASSGASMRTQRTDFSKGTARGYQRWIDDILEESIGPEYPQYLQTQRTFRGQADQQAFMADLAADVQAGGRYFETGARDIDMGKVARRMSEKNVDKPVPGGDSRFMSIERLEELGQTDPAAAMRADVLRRAQQDINTGTFARRTGSGSQGSNTALNLRIQDLIDRRMREGMGLGRRAGAATLRAGELGIYGLSRVAGGVGGPIASGATNFMTRAATSRVGRWMTGDIDRARLNIETQLGRSYTDPAFMAELMRQAPLPVPSTRSLAVGAAGRTLRATGQGWLAGEREARYR